MSAGIIFWLAVGWIGYTYVGYPLILAALARFRPLPHFDADRWPNLTLLIAAYNEEQVIAQKLDNSLALDYPPDRLEIIVAADGSDDRTVEIVEQFAGRGVALSFDAPRRGKMAAINRAMAIAQGEIVVFSDANNLYAADTLRQLTQPFGDPKVGAVTGAKSIWHADGALGRSEGLYWRYESFIKTQETRLGCSVGAPGEIFAIRRSLFVPPPDQVINDDFTLAMMVVRQGYNLFYNPAAKSYEPVSDSAKDEITRRARIVAGRYQALMMAPALFPWRRPLVLWQVISHKFLRPVVPFAMIAALLSNLAAVIWPVEAARLAFWGLAAPFNFIFLFLQLAFYLTAAAGAYLARRGPIARWMYLPVFFVNSNYAALLGFWRFLTGRQSVVWQRVSRSESVYPSNSSFVDHR